MQQLSLRAASPFSPLPKGDRCTSLGEEKGGRRDLLQKAVLTQSFVLCGIFLALSRFLGANGFAVVPWTLPKQIRSHSPSGAPATRLRLTPSASSASFRAPSFATPSFASPSLPAFGPSNPSRTNATPVHYFCSSSSTPQVTSSTSISRIRPHFRASNRWPNSRLSATIMEDVQSIVAEQLGVEKGKVQPESNFIKDLGADSLDSVELVMALEEKFGVDIPDEEATGIRTVQQAVDYVEKHKKNVTK